MSVAEKMAYKRNMVKIRLARFGRKHQPIYNIVVMKAKKAQQNYQWKSLVHKPIQFLHQVMTRV